MAYYSTSQAAAATGASIGTIRTYAKVYARYLSTEATPESGLARQFTAADLRVIRFAHELATRSFPREQIMARLAAGEIEQYAWQPPEPPESAATQAQGAQAAAEAAGDVGTALVPLASLQAAHELLKDAKAREEQALEQLAAAQTEIADLQLQLGEAKGRLEGFRAAQYRAPLWWRRIFGGRVEP